MEAAINLALLFVAVCAIRAKKGPVAYDPYEKLPLQDDVKRWRHDGTQPTEERIGNLFPPIPWPEVKELHLHT